MKIQRNYFKQILNAYPNNPKVPVTDAGHESAIGIKIIFDPSIKEIDLYSINSTEKGNGSKIVEAILSELPLDWQLAVLWIGVMGLG